ncbi:MAG: Arm DNA-binding domain-containing protein [Vibrio sp.]|uniref:Arm DNA-binding domain-containing protein n=1 Tax=Vibrio sp. TaxID=678 RepID=UPI003A8C57DB
MGVLNSRNGKLVLQFRYKGIRCREQTQLLDNKPNRNRLERLLKNIEAEILLDSFDYSKYFPNSRSIKRFVEISQRELASKQYFDSPNSPKFEEFAKTWLLEKQIEWSKGHLMVVEGTIDKYLNPVFGSKKISAINKGQILQFRTILAKVPGRTGSFLSPSRINHIMTPLRMILDETADRYEFKSPWKNIKALKVPRTDVAPFSIQEIEKVISCAPDEFQCYLITRFFTGMRTGEIDGLMWKDIDLTNKVITVSQSLNRGEVSGLKTQGSYRTISLIERVVNALREHKLKSGYKSPFVFTNSKGLPLNYQVVSRNMWYPTLAKSGLKKRNPYQTRHTFATLLLASGESPEWIANQMGHTTTTMLFRIYSRFVPNLTRKDGCAFEVFLQNEGKR